MSDNTIIPQNDGGVILVTDRETVDIYRDEVTTLAIVRAHEGEIKQPTLIRKVGSPSVLGGILRKLAATGLVMLEQGEIQSKIIKITELGKQVLRAVEHDQTEDVVQWPDETVTITAEDLADPDQLGRDKRVSEDNWEEEDSR